MRVCALLFGLTGCTRSVDVTLILASGERPDPFSDVRTLRTRALIGGQVVTLSENRWDQGPFSLPSGLSPGLSRLLVEGLGTDGRVLASGASPPLDWIRNPPDAPVTLFFGRRGAVSDTGIRTSIRRGARGISIAGGGLLVVGGQGQDGCPIEQTEVFRLRDNGLEQDVGPPVPGGRLGEFVLALLPDGRFLVAGGFEAPGCGGLIPSQTVVVMDLETSQSEVFDAQGRVYDGTRVVATGPDGVFFLGGESPSGVTAAVSEFSLNTGEWSDAGQLGRPVTGGAAVALDPFRIMVLGGRTSRTSSSALSDAEIFLPSRGAVLSDRIDLSGSVSDAQALTTVSGNVVMVGGKDASGLPIDAVRSLLFESEVSVPIGTSEDVATLTTSVARVSLVPLEDQSILVLPPGMESPMHLMLGPAQVRAVTLPVGAEGPWVGGRLSDGTVLLRSESGVLYRFNAGPRGILGPLDDNGIFRLSPDVLRSGLGITPLRPEAWSVTEGEGLLGRASAGGIIADLLPREFATLFEESFLDFDLAFDLRLFGQSKAALLFGINGDDFDYVVLHGTTQVERSGLRQIAFPISCNVSVTPDLSVPGLHRIRIRRRQGVVRVDIDESQVLSCPTPEPLMGRLALGVVQGRAAFDALNLALVGL
jgi:hypothetical protein